MELIQRERGEIESEVQTKFTVNAIKPCRFYSPKVSLYYDIHENSYTHAGP